MHQCLNGSSDDKKMSLFLFRTKSLMCKYSKSSVIDGAEAH